MADLPRKKSPWASRRSMVFDVALTAAGLLVVLGMAAAPYDNVLVWLSLFQILPLVIRRIRPTLSFTLIAAAMALQVILIDTPIWGQVALPIAVYSMAVYAPRLHVRAAMVVALVGGVIGPLSWLPSLGPNAGVGTFLGTLLFTELLVIAPWAVGTLSRTRRAYVAALIDRGERLEREAAQQAELAAADERTRIAREMHDVVAHGLSVMIVQADGASYAVHKHPDQAARALETISATGREALGEMRRLLGILRTEQAAGPGTRPQPGLADLEFLLEQSRTAGMKVTADVVRPLPSVPAGVGLTAYRIVQEGLTNVLKHAGPDTLVDVHVTLEDDRLVVEVADDGRGAAASSDGRGLGLTGMRERAAVHGGTLQAGPAPGGGFAVSARLPL